MENKKSCPEKPNTSRKSDLIIITPEELAKLGLFSEVTDIAIPSQNSKNQVNLNSDQKEEVVKKSKNTKGKLVKESKNEEETPSDFKQGKSSASETPSHTSQYLPSGKVSVSTLNLVSNNKKVEEILKRGLSKKLQQIHDNLNRPGTERKDTSACDISQKADGTEAILSPKNTKNLQGDDIRTNLKPSSRSDASKEIKITSDTPVHLSNEELKQLVSKTNKTTTGEKTCLIKHTNKLCDITQNFEDVENTTILKNTSPNSSKNVTDMLNQPLESTLNEDQEVKTKHDSRELLLDKDSKSKNSFIKYDLLKELISDLKANRNKETNLLELKEKEDIPVDVPFHLKETERMEKIGQESNIKKNINSSINNKNVNIATDFSVKEEFIDLKNLESRQATACADTDIPGTSKELPDVTYQKEFLVKDSKIAHKKSIIIVKNSSNISPEDEKAASQSTVNLPKKRKYIMDVTMKDSERNLSKENEQDSFNGLSESNDTAKKGISQFSEKRVKNDIVTNCLLKKSFIDFPKVDTPSDNIMNRSDFNETAYSTSKQKTLTDNRSIDIREMEEHCTHVKEKVSGKIGTEKNFVHVSKVIKQIETKQAQAENIEHKTGLCVPKKRGRPIKNANLGQSNKVTPTTIISTTDSKNSKDQGSSKVNTADSKEIIESASPSLSSNNDEMLISTQDISQFSEKPVKKDIVTNSSLLQKSFIDSPKMDSVSDNIINRSDFNEPAYSTSKQDTFTDNSSIDIREMEEHSTHAKENISGKIGTETNFVHVSKIKKQIETKEAQVENFEHGTGVDVPKKRGRLRKNANLGQCNKVTPTTIISTSGSKNSNDQSSSKVNTSDSKEIMESASPSQRSNTDEMLTSTQDMSQFPEKRVKKDIVTNSSLLQKSFIDSPKMDTVSDDIINRSDINETAYSTSKQETFTDNSSIDIREMEEHCTHAKKKVSAKIGREKNFVDVSKGKKQIETKETQAENIEHKTGLYVPKKRGRPRKNANLVQCNKVTPTTIISTTDSKDSNDQGSSKVNTSDSKEIMEAAFPSLSSNNHEVLTSTPGPKKRGKNKSEQPFLEEINEDSRLTLSRSGRKRKKINYLEFAQEIEEISGREPKIRKYITHSKSLIESKNDISTEIQIGIEKIEDQKITDNVDRVVEENKQAETDLNEINETDGATSDIEGCENGVLKKSKYRKTGETRLMMNSIFAAAFKEKDSEENLDISSEIKSSAILNKSRRGRQPKQLSKESNIVIYSDNMVLCITCNKKVNNDEWFSHNRQEHNNLAWREGEQEFRLDDKQAILKIARQIMKEDGEINCKNCNNSFKVVAEFTGHIERCYGVILTNGLVTCAICKMNMEKTKWSNHKQRQHNNLAWRIGDRPLDLNNQNLVVNILTALYKAKKPLYCSKCGTSKKSVVGFLSHQSQCGVKLENVKIKCQFCEKKVLPVSMQSHIKLVHEKPDEADAAEKSLSSDYNTDSTLSKRKAAKTAMLFINKLSNDKFVQEHSKYYDKQTNFIEENFVQLLVKKELSSNNTIKCKFNNCSYECSDLEITEHMNSCGSKPEEYFTCKRCLAVLNTEKEIKDHFKEIHDIDLVDDEYKAPEYEDPEDEKWEECDMDMKKGSLHEMWKVQNNPNYKVTPTCILNLSKTPGRLFSEAYNYTISFCQQHYSTDGLFKYFPSCASDWSALDDDLVEEYLSPNVESCDVASKKVKGNENVHGEEYAFRRYNLFEVDFDEGITTIYCGGPIHAMAWMPTPYTSYECNQILAIAAVKDFDDKYIVNEHYNDKSVIQFWNFGILKNKSAIPKPQLMFCLAHDFGPVWHLEWCPSGCYNMESENSEEDTARMGLLAVAGSDSVVYVYSVPHFKDEDRGAIYKAKPLLKLCVVLHEDEYLGKKRFYATKIAWSKASGHKYIAIGYTDGVVALFNLDMTSSLLIQKDIDGFDVLLPYKSFQPHQHIITALDLCPLAGGNRWLLTGSFDRNVIIWDLSNNSKITIKRDIISDGVWLSNWMCFLCSADESSKSGGTIPTFLTSYRDYAYERVSFKNSLTSINTISSSSWLNSFIYGSSVGEVTGVYPAQLLVKIDNDKKLKNFVYVLGYSKLVNKPNYKSVQFDDKNTSLSMEVEPLTYHGAKQKYGLLWCDTNMDSCSHFSVKATKSETEESRANMYSMQAINKIAYNPNAQASLYYATGYQVGFVRVAYLKFFENDEQIK